MDLLLSWVEKGGVVMYPLLFLSVVSWAVIIERAFALRLKNFLPPNLNEIKYLLKRGDYEGAYKIASIGRHPFLRALAVVLKEYLSGKKEKGYLLQLMEGELGPMVPKVEKNLIILSTIASVAPLLGLFGTITGLIKVFSAFAFSLEEQATQLLAKGISEALVAAATGLAVAIPSLLAYWVFRAVGNHILDRLSEEATELVNLLE
ncbi:MAG: MotA/TolQ/ExbB proton channel family protein [Aquificae bacterium]|nr:MotA/TolQ/ExbB proton channel family protein [Aquificota bacterium]